MSRPRLVATDLDGTLVRSDESISGRTRAVVAELDDRDIPVVFVTARPMRWMDDLRPMVGRHGLAVVSNGAIVYDLAAAEVREWRGIEPRDGLALAAAVRAAVPGATLALETLSGPARDEAFVDPDRAPEGTRVGPLAEIWTEAAVKVLVRAPSMEPEAFRAAVVEAVGERAVATWTLDGLVEISPPGVTKASGLMSLCAGLGVAAEDVVAFGDMPNDLPMLAWAGTSYAVANAHPSVLAAADHLTASNDEDGVAVALAEIFGLAAPVG